LKVGLLGGTFDPIHCGHLQAASNARASLALDSVLFVPASVPPHRAAPVASVHDRFAMVALATAGCPYFVPSDVELARGGPSYTADTLEQLRERRPGDSFVLVVGHDAFDEIGSWKDTARLFTLCDVAVVGRPGSAGALADLRGATVHTVAGTELPISASEIRRRCAAGEGLADLVPVSVAEYIAKRGLYR